MPRSAASTRRCSTSRPGSATGSLARFWKVGLPGAAAGIRAGLLLAWLRALGEYGATVILAYHPYTLPVFTSVQFDASGLSTTEAPTALALGLAVVVVTLTRLRRRTRRRVVRSLPSPVAPPVVKGEPVSFDLALRLGSFHLQLEHRGASGQLAILGPSRIGEDRHDALPRGPLRVLARDCPLRRPRRDRRADRGAPRRLPAPGGHAPPASHRLGPAAVRVWREPSAAAYWLERLGLAGLENRLPEELSGGQRQRVGLAQALSRLPRLLLLDEPFSALDAPVRADLRRELRQLQRETGISTVLVTHDPEEAALLASEVMVISDGSLLQAGTRREVFAKPSSPRVRAPPRHRERPRRRRARRWRDRVRGRARSTR